MLRLTFIVALAAAAAAAVTVAPAAMPAASCSFFNDPPSLYAGDIVLTNGGVACTGAARTRVTLELSRDGVVVNDARRNCRAATKCTISTDASVTDVPGDQRYCAHAVGYVDGTPVGESTACETEGF